MQSLFPGEEHSLNHPSIEFREVAKQLNAIQQEPLWKL